MMQNFYLYFIDYIITSQQYSMSEKTATNNHFYNKMLQKTFLMTTSQYRTIYAFLFLNYLCFLLF